MSAISHRVPLDARRVDAIECVVSVLLAIALAHWTGARNVSWAAFSGYMVMRGHVSETLLRGLLRIVGTGVGAALALLLVPWAVRGVAAMSLLLALVTLPTLYAALTAKRAYAWLFVALTFTMVVLDAAGHPGVDVRALVATRLGQRAVGCVAGAGYAGAVLLLHASSALLLVAVAAGVAVGRLAENGWQTRSYVGTQFVLAVLVTLVPDQVEQAAVAPALARLAGIAVGLAVLEPVLVAWHLVAPPPTLRHDDAAPAEPGSV